ncbi:YibE/F family protein [Cetobacterium sp. 2A]|uniref:YibE/F family protein n=1 Tax=Cetobacterium sp. 2A TaxID=2754723 RepID=UPI00163C6A89|nr:YibE/F family protein [Cetobacterium sp. 2A]MBC2856257.1 YibE/F family protein [Cetobacterium sp. 2A]
MKEKILPILVLISIILMAWISPKYTEVYKGGKVFKQEFVSGKIMRIVEENLMKDPVIEGKFRGSQKLEVEILEGSEKGNIHPVYNTLSNLHNTYATKDLKAIFTVREKDGKKIVWLYNQKRDIFLYGLSTVFLLLVFIMGKMKGVKSILSLIFTGAVIIYLLLPMLFAGVEPIPSSIALVSIIILISFLLIGGFNRKTYSAIVGTIFGITLGGLISYFSGEVMNLSGINMEGGEQLLYIAKDYSLKIKGLLFVSILIASLGAVMDVAMSIASSTNELYEHQRDISMGQLFISSMNIGKDIMGTMVNTLILAFAGSSLPMIMMIWGYDMSYNQFINIPSIAIEITNGLAGSIGIIATVPFTAAISIMFIKREKREMK